MLCGWLPDRESVITSRCCIYQKANQENQTREGICMGHDPLAGCEKTGSTCVGAAESCSVPCKSVAAMVDWSQSGLSGACAWASTGALWLEVTLLWTKEAMEGRRLCGLRTYTS